MYMMSSVVLSSGMPVDSIMVKRLMKRTPCFLRRMKASSHNFLNLRCVSGVGTRGQRVKHTEQVDTKVLQYFTNAGEFLSPPLVIM